MDERVATILRKWLLKSLRKAAEGLDLVLSKTYLSAHPNLGQTVSHPGMTCLAGIREIRRSSSQ